MKIRDYIIDCELRAAKDRLERLEKMDAPEIMIVGMRKVVDEMSKGTIEIGGEQELLDIEVETWEVKKGRGGKTYACINGSVNYFPKAKYGRFITKA